MGGVSMEYEETVVERRVRRVRVEDDEHGEVTAWHGGRLLAELSGWTSLRAAVADAREQAERFAVDAASSLSIRVSRTVTRRWSYPDEPGGGRVRPERVVARRHVLDVARGELPAAEARLAFRLGGWVAMPAGEDPTPCLPYFVGIEVEGITNAALHAGYGHGEPVFAAPFVGGSEIDPPDCERGMSMHRVTVEGHLPVLVPPGGDAATLAAGGLRLDFDRDAKAIPDELWRRCRIYGTRTAADHRLVPAPLALAGPA